MTSFSDRVGIGAAEEAAFEAHARGDLPIGAALLLDGSLLASEGNRRRSGNDFSLHAESQLLRDNVLLFLDGPDARGKVELFSTLEPCLMCLGMAALLRVSRIVYLLRDPHAGACDINPEHMSASRYRRSWPVIVAAGGGMVVRSLMEDYCVRSAERGERVEYHREQLRLLRAGAFDVSSEAGRGAPVI